MESYLLNGQDKWQENRFLTKYVDGDSQTSRPWYIKELRKSKWTWVSLRRFTSQGFNTSTDWLQCRPLTQLRCGTLMCFCGHMGAGLQNLGVNEWELIAPHPPPPSSEVLRHQISATYNAVLSSQMSHPFQMRSEMSSGNSSKSSCLPSALWHNKVQKTTEADWSLGSCLFKWNFRYDHKITPIPKFVSTVSSVIVVMS